MNYSVRIFLIIQMFVIGAIADDAKRRETSGVEPSDPVELVQHLTNNVHGEYHIADALRRLGNIYFYGLESSPLAAKKTRVPQDLDKAKEMFEECLVSRSFPSRGDCLVGLGHVYLENKKQKDALAQFEKANAYGVMWGVYHFGIGVPKNEAVAKSYIQKAKKTKINPYDLCTQGVLDAIGGYEKGDARALVDMAYQFKIFARRTDCLPGGPKYHIELLERAARRGSIQAAKDLAQYYDFRDLVPHDPVLAHMYYSVLSLADDAEMRNLAKGRMESIERTLSSEQLATAQALSREWRKEQAAHK